MAQQHAAEPHTAVPTTAWRPPGSRLAPTSRGAAPRQDRTTRRYHRHRRALRRAGRLRGANLPLVRRELWSTLLQQPSRRRLLRRHLFRRSCLLRCCLALPPPPPRAAAASASAASAAAASAAAATSAAAFSAAAAAVAAARLWKTSRRAALRCLRLLSCLGSADDAVGASPTTADARCCPQPSCAPSGCQKKTTTPCTFTARSPAALA